MRHLVVSAIAGMLSPFFSTAGGAVYQANVLYQLNVPAGYRTAQFSGMFGSQVVGKLEDASGNPFAAVWSGNSPVNLNPSGFTWSYASGTNGVQQVGEGTGPGTGNSSHALLWTGSANSFIDLNPAGFVSSDAGRIAGGQQVGNGTILSGQTHALLWQGTAASAIDLNPAGYATSYANGTDGTRQVGSATMIAGEPHATLWTGTAASAIDLHPAGFISSYAYGIVGQQEVGGGYTGIQNHALLWTGTAASAVDLNPFGFTYTEAEATNGLQQVGGGEGATTGPAFHALLWNGSASSYVDLHTFLPQAYTISSAFEIDAVGDVFGIANDASGNHYAVEWTPVPEPGSAAILAMAAFLLPRVRHNPTRGRLTTHSAAPAR